MSTRVEPTRMEVGMRRFGLVFLLAAAGLLGACAHHAPAREGEADPADTPQLEAPAKGRVLSSSTYIRASYDDVWKELASAEGYSRWYSAPLAEIVPERGGTISFGAKDKPIILGKISRIKKGEGLSHSFAFSWFENEVSNVHFTVLEQGEVVLVDVVHDCSSAPQVAGIIGSHGWQKALSRLKSLLETGEAMPWPDDAPRK
ncbi:MAG: SRPBCC domain-containing protein [Planctomycetes bacterium]|nr:SRPBCC domain-containing protein [Planctomycetota bacterium]